MTNCAKKGFDAQQNTVLCCVHPLANAKQLGFYCCLLCVSTVVLRRIQPVIYLLASPRNSAPVKRIDPWKSGHVEKVQVFFYSWIHLLNKKRVKGRIKDEKEKLLNSWIDTFLGGKGYSSTADQGWWWDKRGNSSVACITLLGGRLLGWKGMQCGEKCAIIPSRGTAHTNSVFRQIWTIFGGNHNLWRAI